MFTAVTTYCTSQVVGTMSLSPLAPARIHADASSLILAIRRWVDGWAWSKMQLLRCFQTIGTRSVIEAKPLHIGLGVATVHQSKSEDSVDGRVHETCSQARILCETCREKGHPISRWCIVSMA